MILSHCDIILVLRTIVNTLLEKEALLMNKISQKIVRHKRIIVAFFIVVTVISGLASLGVGVNYKLSDYLPKEANSTKALAVMEEEFGTDIVNAYVTIYDAELDEVMEYKNRLEGVYGILEVTWLDDVADIKEPVEAMDESIVNAYYKDGNAKFDIVIDENYDEEAVSEIYNIIGENNTLTGPAIGNELQKRMAESEVIKTMVFVVPLAILILVLSTTSWIEPFLFLAATGVAVIINMGTNIFFGDVSYITRSVSPILQLAVSLDYAIFLLHSFERNRKVMEIETAMVSSIEESFSAIMASASTTLFGFAALGFMEFGIGADLGINLVKGIIFSFISVVVLLPALTLYLYKFIDKTRHKSVFPNFYVFSREIQRFKIPALMLVMLIIIPSFLAQNSNDFLYGNEALSESTRLGEDEVKLDEVYGRNTPIVLLVPKGEPSKEDELTSSLKSKYGEITSVISYASSVGVQVPKEYLDYNIVDTFYSDNYSRIIINADTSSEGDKAFSLVESIKSEVGEYYEDDTYLLGESVSLYDIKESITKDSFKVSIIAIIAIMMVILISFKSLTLPVLLVFVIQGAIWINLSVPYFSGNQINYIGFLIISTVQLGATVDYAIIMSDTYMKKRKLYDKSKATWSALVDTVGSIFVSGCILSSAGLCLNIISANPIISELGTLLCRGTLLSMALVVFVLPGILNIFDKLIEKTTMNSNYYVKGDSDEK